MRFRTQRVCNYDALDAPAGVRYVFYTPRPARPLTDMRRIALREQKVAKRKKEKEEMLAQRQLVIRRRIEEAAHRGGVLREAQYLMSQPEYLEWAAKQTGADMDWATDPEILFSETEPVIFTGRYPKSRKRRPYIKETYEALKKEKAYSQIWGNRLYYQRQATPVWCDHAAIDELVLERIRYDMRYPEQAPWHLDHIVPLKSKLVCGLHVPENLRIIPGAENIKKKNRFDETISV